MKEEGQPPEQSQMEQAASEEAPRADRNSTTEKTRILHERAAELSREVVEPEAASETIEVVEFQLAYENYAVETRFVREVRVLKDLTPIPCTPPFIAGMINVRSQILTVIDIKRFFDLPDRGIEDLHHVLILRMESMELAVVTDLIKGVREISLEHVQASLPTLTGVRAEYLKGVTPGGLVILDVQKILSSKKIIVYEEPVS